MATRQQGEALVAAITSDHREVEVLFEELAAGGDPEHRRTLADQAIMMLVRHAVAEEHYVYPMAKARVEATLTDQLIAEHSEAEKVMKDLEGLDPGDSRFDQLLETLMTEVREHMRHEEQELLPRLVERFTSEQLTQMTAGFLQSRGHTSPTRPHPMAPDTPPLNLLADYGVGLVDRLRDRLTHRGEPGGSGLEGTGTEGTGKS